MHLKYFSFAFTYIDYSKIMLRAYYSALASNASYLLLAYKLMNQITCIQFFVCDGYDKFLLSLLGVKEMIWK